MKKLVLYRVKFYIKKFGEHHYFYYCYAHNAKEARSLLVKSSVNLNLRMISDFSIREIYHANGWG